MEVWEFLAYAKEPIMLIINILLPILIIVIYLEISKRIEKH